MTRTSLTAKAALIEQRKRELGLSGTDYVPVNAGKARTDSKRALLERLREVAGRSGRALVFAASRR